MLSIRALARPGLLRPFDLDLGDGEAVAVLGPSGSGKTILLRAVVDLDPNEGSVGLDGREREGMAAPEWRRRVTYLAAEPGWWEATVAPHFPEPERGAALLAALGLPEEAMGWSLDRMSTGERQRAALARLLVLEPRVMVLDEPTSGLDEETARVVEGVLRARLEGGAAMLFVTHAEDQARRFTRRALRLSGGAASEVAL